MAQYFFKMSQAEKNDILDKHKTIYDGYVTQYGGGNMTPLTVVDMARDKEGVTVNNKGVVSGYKNVGINESINEMRFDGKNTGLFSNEESVYSLDEHDEIEKSNRLKVGAPLDMIADREDDVKHGTVDFNKEIEFFDLGDVLPFDAENYKGSVDMYFPEEEDEVDVHFLEYEPENDDETVLTLGQDFDTDLIEPLQEQLDRTREMFLRFNKYN